jgi:hypothetical protein
MPDPIRVFISYARPDKMDFEKVRQVLDLLKRNRNTAIWSDHEINAGSNWNQEILGNLRSARIIIFLLSFDFLNSNYIQEIEVQEAFRRYREGKVVIIPILINKCPWEEQPELAALQILPRNKKPLRHLSKKQDPRDELYGELKRVETLNLRRDRAEIA